MDAKLASAPRDVESVFRCFLTFFDALSPPLHVTKKRCRLVTCNIKEAQYGTLDIPPGLSAVGISGLQAGGDVNVKHDKVGQAFGRINADALVEVERCLAVFLGIAK